MGKNDNQRRSAIKMRIRSLIGAGLRRSHLFRCTILIFITEAVTNNSTIKMSWKRYEYLIVIQHGVILEGWPNAVFDPNNLGLRELEDILAMILNGKCVWKKLTEDELERRRQEYMTRLANGEVQVQKRKKRSDAGKKRRRPESPHPDSDGVDDDEPGSDDTNSGGSSTPGPTKRRKTAGNLTIDRPSE